MKVIKIINLKLKLKNVYMARNKNILAQCLFILQC